MITAYLFGIGDYLVYLYSLLIVASIYYYRSFNSFVITALVLAVSDLGMNLLRDPLWAFVGKKEYGHLIWCIVWMASNFLALHVLQVLHVRLNVSAGKVAFFVSQCFVALMAIQIVLSINSYVLTKPIQILDNIYQFGVPSINAIMAFYVIAYFVKEVIHACFVSNSIND